MGSASRWILRRSSGLGRTPSGRSTPVRRACACWRSAACRVSRTSPRSSESSARPTRWRAAASATLVAGAALALGLPSAALADCLGDTPSTGNAPTPKPGGRALEFGIYPGGAAGQLIVPAAPRPEDPAKTLAALGRLTPARGPFTVHIYRSYTSAAADAAEEAEQRRLVDLYTGRGYGVEIVIRYRRNDDPGGFARFVRGVVDRFGANRLVRGFQVTNEVNFSGSADSSDGAYSGAGDGLIRGVIAAKREARL